MNPNERKPVLIVIAGPNGSGKTTITRKILHHEWMEDSVYINPDIVAQERFGDWNSKEAVMQAVKYCEDWREQCLKEKQSLIFKSISNCKFLSDKTDRTYLYDNSVDRADASLLLRLSDGLTAKRYVNELPEWAKQIIEE